MTPERWKKVEKVFQSALKQAPEEQSAYLERACEGDESLRHQVETLIASYKKAGDFIAENPTAEEKQRQAEDTGSAFIGRRIGS